MYSIDGDINVTTIPVEVSSTVVLPFKASNMYVDESGVAYHDSVIELVVNDVRRIALLDAEEVELIMKLLRVVDDEE